MLQCTARILSHRDIAGIDARMPETKENPPFNEMFSKDMLNLMLDKITFGVMRFFVF